MALPRPVVRIANAITTAAIIAGIPRPTLYAEERARHRNDWQAVGEAPADPGRGPRRHGGIIVVVEDGSHSNWVRNALAQDGHPRIHLRGQWRSAKLRMLEAEPEIHLRRMNRTHAFFVRSESSTPAVAELVLE
jgi:hypothetical protein